MAGAFFRPTDFMDLDDDPEDPDLPQGRKVRANARGMERQEWEIARRIAEREGLGAAPVRVRQASPEELERIFGERRAA